MIDFKTQKFAVVGVGDTGLSIINYLYYQHARLIKIFDTRETPPCMDTLRSTLKNTFREIPLHWGKLNYSLFAGIDVIVLSPGVSIYEPAIQMALKNNKQIVGDIELFAQAITKWKSKVVGITGSNGKTTVTALTGYLLQQLGMQTLVAGNIGTPVLTSYLEIVKSGTIPDAIVLELSSFQLETLYSLQLDVATVLNISEDHLDRYRDLLEYAYVKANIFNNCKVQVLNHDYVFTRAMLRPTQQVLWFGDDSSNQFTFTISAGETYLQVNGHEFMSVDQLQLVGRHNYFNVLASLALLSAIDIDVTQEKVQQSLCKFAGLEHRMQKVVEHNGVLYIEDSKGTNVGAVVAGISGLDRPVHLILGGDGKGQDFTPLRELVAKKCKSVALIGRDKELIAEVLSGLTVVLERLDTLEDAVQFCIKQAKAGDCVALSPACASWDMFSNYKERAQVFRDSVYANIK